MWIGSASKPSHVCLLSWNLFILVLFWIICLGILVSENLSELWLSLRTELGIKIPSYLGRLYVGPARSWLGLGMVVSLYQVAHKHILLAQIHVAN